MGKCIWVSNARWKNAFYQTSLLGEKCFLLVSLFSLFLHIEKLKLQMETFGSLGCQHFPSKRSLSTSWDLSILLWEQFPSIWSTHLSQSNQWAMDGILFSAAHHSHFLTASRVDCPLRPNLILLSGMEGLKRALYPLHVTWMCFGE